MTKHEQIVEGVIALIEDKALCLGDELPSVNQAIEDWKVSRMTIVKAYNELKERGIIGAKNRKGYFIVSEDVKKKLKVLLMLTSFNLYHEAMYNAILENVNSEDVQIDLCFHHRNPDLFQTLIANAQGKYGKYIITPFKHELVKQTLETIDTDKLFIISRPEYIKEKTSYVVQDFKQPLQEVLSANLDKIKKYEAFNLITLKEKLHPKEVADTFKSFCKSNNIQCRVVDAITDDEISKNELYLVVDDRNLVQIIKGASEKGYALGKDIGLISYNDSPMKEIIRDGLTTITTDFSAMGRYIAKALKSKEKMQIILKSEMINRASF